MFRNTIIFLFLAVMILQSGFYSAYTILKIKQHRASVKAMMKKELKNGQHNAELVTFSEDDLKLAEWEHSKEFFLGQEKYDVVRVESNTSGKVYHCVNDKKEIQLYKELEKNKKQKTILEDVVKKFCLNFLNDNVRSERHSSFAFEYVIYYSNTYSFIFTNDCLRPPNSAFI